MNARLKRPVHLTVCVKTLLDRISAHVSQELRPLPALKIALNHYAKVRQLIVNAEVVYSWIGCKIRRQCVHNGITIVKLVAVCFQ